jgi:hypothetical protein
MQTTELQINENALDELLGKAVVDCGAAWHAPLVILGARLGLYEALAKAGPLTSAELAARTSTAERYVREWLRASAASGYVTYDRDDDRYFLTPEQAFCLATEGSPAALIPAFESAVFGSRSMEAMESRFRTGEGYGWHLHHTHFFTAVEKFFRSGYEAHLTSQWIPALDGVADKLERGARVADIGLRARRIDPAHGTAISELRLRGLRFARPFHLYSGQTRSRSRRVEERPVYRRLSGGLQRRAV